MCLVADSLIRVVQRTDAMFRNHVKVGDAEFPPEAGRYHLYISNACPWANRCHTVMRMKGLVCVPLPRMPAAPPRGASSKTRVFMDCRKVFPAMDALVRWRTILAHDGLYPCVPPFT